MVTFWPVDVVSVKPDEVTLLAVPTEPPAAGPDRALDPLPPAPEPPAKPPAPEPPAKPPAPEPPAKPWPPPLLVVLLLLLTVVALLEVASTIP
jgi:hypothetical protein